MCFAVIQELKASLETARAQLIPKRKFAFKSKVSRVKGSEVKADNTAQTTQPDTVTSNTDAAPRPAATERDLQLVAAGRGLSGLSDQVSTQARIQPAQASVKATAATPRSDG